MTVKIVDEFGIPFVFECVDVSEVQKVVSEWLESLDTTPLYEITISF